MSNSTGSTDESIRLDRFITWAGAWSTIALVAALLMTSAILLLASLPGEDATGNKPLQILIGLLILAAASIMVILTGRSLARRIDPQKKSLLAMPALASIGIAILSVMLRPWFDFTLGIYGWLLLSLVFLLASTAGRVIRRKGKNQTPLLNDSSQAWTK